MVLYPKISKVLGVALLLRLTYVIYVKRNSDNCYNDVDGNDDDLRDEVQWNAVINDDLIFLRN